MPVAKVNGVNLVYEEAGAGVPLLFVHEFVGDSKSWHLQVRYFARRYRTITFNARGFPPSDVPQSEADYSQDIAVEDIKGILDHLEVEKAHVCGLSMGAYSTLNFGLRFPERVLSLTLAGCGSGSFGDRLLFLTECERAIACFEQNDMKKVADFYTLGPTRVQFRDKDPLGWQEFYDQFVLQSAQGHALTMRGIQMKRPTIVELGTKLEKLSIPVLIIVGDEDDPCIESSIFMKRKIPAAGLIVVPKSGHAVNLEEPEIFNRELMKFIDAAGSQQWHRRNPMSVGGAGIFPVKRQTDDSSALDLATAR
jgi:pimeloyl-ACP methyl ester carboxylesterase